VHHDNRPPSDTSCRPSTSKRAPGGGPRLHDIQFYSRWPTPWCRAGRAQTARPTPPDAFTRVDDATLALRGSLTVVVGGGPRKRVRGVRLVADGIDWRYGEGPEMRGSPEASILLLNGRSVGRDELSGPGVPPVLARLR
jgi:hypothetical protein